MKKTFVFFALLSLLCLTLISCTEYDDIAEYQNTVYPLAEFNFADGTGWSVVICEDIYENDGEYYICDSEEKLEKNKNKLCVDAVSETSLQSPEHLVWIVNDGTIKAAVACSDYEFLSEIFENSFRKTTFEEINSVADLGV